MINTPSFNTHLVYVINKCVIYLIKTNFYNNINLLPHSLNSSLTHSLTHSLTLLTHSLTYLSPRYHKAKRTTCCTASLNNEDVSSKIVVYIRPKQVESREFIMRESL